MLNVTADMYTHTSDHFDLIMTHAEKFIREGKAYCDNTPPDKMKEEREQKIKSANRDNGKMGSKLGNKFWKPKLNVL